MSGRQVRSLTVLLALLVLVTVVSEAGCGGDADYDVTSSETESTDSGVADDDAISNEGTQDGSHTESTGDVLTTEQEEAAVDIAGAYFVAQTDFTVGQFDWKVEAAAQDNDGQWWARVSATPKEDISLETEQIYVYSPAGSGFWLALDMGTGIDPPTDQRFPEEVRHRLW